MCWWMKERSRHRRGTIDAAISKFIISKQSFTHLIRIESLEEVNGLLEKVDNFLLWDIVGIAAGLQCANASSMFTPLMLPEALIIALIILPICIHIVE